MPSRARIGGLSIQATVIASALVVVAIMAGAGSLILAAEPAWARTAAPERIALPAELPYVLKGAVVRLYAPQTYQWGYRSIEIRADKVILKKDPATAVIYSPLLLVDKSNVDQTEQDRKRWLWQ